MAQEGKEKLAVPAKKGSGLQSRKLLKLGRKRIVADRPKKTTDCFGVIYEMRNIHQGFNRQAGNGEPSRAAPRVCNETGLADRP